MAASIGGSLALHLFLIAGISLLWPFFGHAVDGAGLPRLTVSLPHASLPGPRIPSEPEVRQQPDMRTDAENFDTQTRPIVPAPIALPTAEPRFFSLAELDTPPVAVQDIETDPPELRPYPQGGKLIMQLWIDETGRVVKTEALRSDLPEPFTASARENFMHAVFTPARKNGLAVGARVSVAIVYQPR